jgi:hypothetical protein
VNLFLLRSNAWLWGAIATITAVASQSDSLLILTASTWSALLFVYGLKFFVPNKAALKKFYWRVVGAASVYSFGVASLLVPLNASAQATASGKCSSLGFLNALGTLTTNAFTGLTTGSTSTTGTNIVEQICGLGMVILWILVFGSVAAIIMLAIRMYNAGSAGWGEAGQTLAVPVFIVAVILAMFTLYGVG